jgi:hypothetical protein
MALPDESANYLAFIQLDRSPRADIDPIGMSALGQKRTCAAQKDMSALPPKADMCSALTHVCFVPIADIGRHQTLMTLGYAPLEDA